MTATESMSGSMPAGVKWPLNGSDGVYERQPGQPLEDFLRNAMDLPVMNEDLREVDAMYDFLPNLNGDDNLYVLPQRFVEIQYHAETIKLTPAQAVRMARHLLASARVLEPGIDTE